ncbi:hypothetical protein AGMMS49975_10150 [Clostridia bacterium]|nr:hypothetical protein AGMMS49975_10150 [Clostridia bacterium]
MNKRKFVEDSWDYDCDGYAYIVAKDCVKTLADVVERSAAFYCGEPRENPEEYIQGGWCKYQVRTDWYEFEGERRGSYIVFDDTDAKKYILNTNGKRKLGWFPVWILRFPE